MKKIKFPYTLILIIALIGSIACTERIDIDTLAQEPRLVVFGFISDSPDSYCIELSKTQPFFGELDPNQTAITGAIVTINDISLEENLQCPGKYYTHPQFTALSGKEYKLRVEVDFDQDGTIEIFESTTQIPSSPSLDSVVITPNIIQMFPRTNVMLAFNYYFQPTIGSYPGASFSIREAPKVDRITRHMLSPMGRIIENHYISGFPFFMLRPDYYTDINNDTIYIQPASQYKVGLRSYSPELFEFIRISKIESRPGNPLFSGPPANVPSNISNGALGCFGSYSEVIHKAQLPWNEELIKGKWVDRSSGMIIEIEGNQAKVIENGMQKLHKVGDIYLKNIKIDNNSSIATCQIKEYDGFQPDRIDWSTYLHFNFIRNGGLWIRL